MFAVSTLLLLAHSTFGGAQSTWTEVRRGIMLPDGVPYAAVQDTTLDSMEPNANFGFSPSLWSGSGATILIRFGDLKRALGVDRIVEQVSLRLWLGNDESPTGVAVRQLSAPWGEGPWIPIAERVRRAGGSRDPAAPAWSSSWRMRRAGEGGSAWRSAGTGEGDGTALSGVTLRRAGEWLYVDGLGPAVSQWYARSLENYGLALRFSDIVQFASNQVPDTGPIARQPALLVRTAPAQKVAGPDLSVIKIDLRTADGGASQAVAVVKNLGSVPVASFECSWTVREQRGSSIVMPRPLGPGESTEIAIPRPQMTSEGEPKAKMLRFEVQTPGDIDPDNNALEVSEASIPVVLSLPRGFAPLDLAPEDWSQHMVRLWNETLLPMSRFSHAPDGATDRIRLSTVHADLAGDAWVGKDPVREALLQIASQLGLPKWSHFQVSSGTLANVGMPNRSFNDWKPGLLGGGDHRYEGNVGGRAILSFAPVFRQGIPPGAFSDQGLLASTDVSLLNANAGKPVGERMAQWRSPNAVLVQARDGAGQPLIGTEIAFFQSKEGSFDLTTPCFTALAGSDGNVILPNRGTGPFAEPSSDGSNGVLLARAERNGVVDWTTLKLWQLHDLATRGATATGFVEMVFHIPLQPVDTSANVAINQTASTSNRLGLQETSRLIDGDVTTYVEIPSAEDPWIEIDLGRDRTIAEVQIVADANMWDSFQVLGYATGQRVTEAQRLYTEVDWRWTLGNRADVEGAFRRVTYRGSLLRFRYLRLVGKNGSAKVREVRAFTIVP